MAYKALPECFQKVNVLPYTMCFNRRLQPSYHYTRDLIVIDIGSSFGEFSKFIASQNQQIQVHSIEPNSESTESYFRSMKNLEVHNIAIWSKSKTVKIFL